MMGQNDNQQQLVDALASLRSVLHHHIDTATPAATIVPNSALAQIASNFALSPFERDLLLLCAAVELDGDSAALCAEANNGQAAPTFSLALAALPGAHWDALSPARPLRRWHLLELGPGTALTNSPLRIAEPALHAIAGVPTLDERLLRLVEPVVAEPGLPPSHTEIAAQVRQAWQHSNGKLPLLQLYGTGIHAARVVAAAACAEIGLALFVLSAARLPHTAGEIEQLAALWQRDALLTGAALLIEVNDLDSDEQSRAALALAEQIGGVVLLATRERRAVRRANTAFEITRPPQAEQRALWRASLGAWGATLNGQIDEIAAQFSLDASAIQQASSSVTANVSSTASADEVRQAIWRRCRDQARSQLDQLAQHIPPTADWNDLVLPEQQRTTLHDIAAQVRQRAKVYEQWGFGGTSGRGLGMSALFSGPSGTGKTTAAEVLAGALDLDLYRIDLSGVVSKYIGETEKNLRRIFDAAEQSGAILLFDEADALFGKRSEVKDSHDRHANIEVSYLLQRMETYRGLAILTTNMRHALDTAFLRRIRFVVQFPFPDPIQRAEIWRRMIPVAAPTEGLQYEKLARLNIAGGNIRTIALNAAFIAADADEPLRMAHLLRAARSEYAKLEKPLTETEIAGW